MENNLNLKLEALENKIDSLSSLVQGLIINRNQNQVYNSPISRVVDLVPDIEQLDYFGSFKSSW